MPALARKASSSRHVLSEWAKQYDKEESNKGNFGPTGPDNVIQCTSSHVTAIHQDFEHNLLCDLLYTYSTYFSLIPSIPLEDHTKCLTMDTMEDVRAMTMTTKRDRGMMFNTSLVDPSCSDPTFHRYNDGAFVCFFLPLEAV